MDLRRARRFPVRWPVTIRLSPSAYVTAEARDIGPGGLGLELRERTSLPPNVMLMLGTALGPILGVGKLKWERPIWHEGAVSRAGFWFEPHAGFSSVRYELALEALARGESVPPQEPPGRDDEG